MNDADADAVDSGGSVDSDGSVDAAPSERPDDLEVRTDEGRTVYVSRRETERGSEAPFFVAYLAPDRGRRYGWLCGNCDTFDNAMDSMGRIECNVCANFRKPTEWDAAHE